MDEIEVPAAGISYRDSNCELGLEVEKTRVGYDC